MTPETVLNSIRTKFNETSTLWIDNNQIYTFMWEAEQILNDEIECYQTTNTSIVSDGSAQEYTIDSNVDIIKRVTWDSVPLKKIDFRDQDSLDYPTYGGTPSTGDAEFYYQFGTVIGLYPVPTTSQQVKIWHTATPATLTSGSTVFSIPRMFHNDLQDYVLYQMFSKDQDDGRANTHLSLWKANLKEAYTKWMRRNRANMFQVVREEENYPTSELGIK